MPYGYSRKRGSRVSGRRTTKRTRKSRTGYAKSASAKSLSAKSTALPYGVNLGSALHVDRGIGNNRALMPARLATKMRYVDKLALYSDNLTGRTGTEIPYRLNSLFDPYFLAGGHQPLGYDQVTPLYQRYKVFKVDIQVAIRGRIGSGAPYLAINIRNAASTYQLGGLKELGEVLEQPANTVMDGGLLTQTWNKTVWCHEVEGKTFDEYMSEDAYGALISTNPSNTPYMGVAVGTVDELASTTTGLYVTVAFVFHGFFYEPNPLAQS